MKNTYIIYLLIIATSMIACTEVNTDNPQKAYKYRSKQKLSDDIEVINGKYWKSAHWTYEYKVYLQLQTSEEWWKLFIEQNNLTKISAESIKPDNAPEWFAPPARYEIYKIGNIDFANGGIYLRDSITSTCYIYEIQL